MDPYKLTIDEKRLCRKLAKQGGTISVYARLSLAATQGCGVRLSADEVDEIFRDLAVSDAIVAAVVEASGGVPW